MTRGNERAFFLGIQLAGHAEHGVTTDVEDSNAAMRTLNAQLGYVRTKQTAVWARVLIA